MAKYQTVIEGFRIKNWLKYPIGLVGEQFSLQRLIHHSDNKFVFPFYHCISPKTPIHIQHLYPCITPEKFASDLESLLNVFDPVDIYEVNQYAHSGEVRGKPKMFLSFDDGLSECYEFVRPILKEKSIPAAFFINTDFIDNKGMFFRYKLSILSAQLLTASLVQIEELKNILGLKTSSRKRIVDSLMQLSKDDEHLIEESALVLEVDFADYLESHKPYMTLEQLESLKRDGFTLGGHGTDHSLISSLPYACQENELMSCMNKMKNLFDLDLFIFAFPFTDFGVQDSLFKYMYRDLGVHLSFGTAGHKQDAELRHIQRIPMEWNRPTSAVQILKFELIYAILRKYMGRTMAERQILNLCVTQLF